MNPYEKVVTNQEDRIYPCVYFKHLLQVCSHMLITFCRLFRRASKQKEKVTKSGTFIEQKLDFF